MQVPSPQQPSPCFTQQPTKTHYKKRQDLLKRNFRWKKSWRKLWRRTKKKKWEKWKIVCGKKSIKHFYTTNLFNAVQYDTIWYQSVRFLVKSRFHGKRKKAASETLVAVCIKKPASKKLSTRFAASTFRRRKIDEGSGRGRKRNAKVQSRNKLIQFSFFWKYYKTLIVMQNKTLAVWATNITLPFVLIAQERKLFHPPLIRCLFF